MRGQIAMLSMRDIERIKPTKVHLDLPTRVRAVENDFFGKKGNWAYQLKLCEELQTKCAVAAMHEMVNNDGGIVANRNIRNAIDIMERMDAMILKGIQKTEGDNQLQADRR